jgi:hypothetical protein
MNIYKINKTKTNQKRNKQYPRNWSDFCSLPVRHNCLFKIGGSIVCFSRCVNCSIILVNDFLDNKGYLLSFDDFLTKFDINTNTFLEYQNIVESIRRYLKSAVFKTPGSERGNAYSAFNDQDNQ